MTRASLILLGLFAWSVRLAAQHSPSPEQCLVRDAVASPIVVTHGGKGYALANEACRAQFLSDPERYSQLYDALAELEAAGVTVSPAPASLVPS